MRFYLFLFFALSVPSELVSQEAVCSVRNAQLVLIEDVELASKDGGKVAELNFKTGDVVKKNDSVLSLDSKGFAAEVAVAKGELDIATKASENKADLQYAEKSVEVSSNLFERSQEARSRYVKVVSKTELDRLRMETEQAMLSKKQALSQLEVNGLTAGLRKEQLTIAELNLANRQVRSPIEGVVIEVLPQVGEWVTPGEKVARIVNLTKLRVEANVPAKLIDKVSVGQQAKFNGRIGEKLVSGDAKIVFVSPLIDPVNQDIRVWAEIDNSAGKLRPGSVGELLFLK